MSQQPYFDPFSSATLTTIAPLLLHPNTTWDGFRFDNRLESELLRLNELETKDLLDIRPHLLSLDLKEVSLPDLSTPPSISADSSDNEFFEVQEQPSEDDGAADIWVLPDVFKRRSTNRLICWDSFRDDHHEEPQSSYISEANPKTFSTILRDASCTKPSRTLKDGVFLNAVFELIMGRSSSLFRWDEETKTFSANWGDISATGYSGTILRNTFEAFTTIGNDTRQISDLFRMLDNTTRRILPTRVALLSSARSVLFALHKYIESARTHVCSLLQLNRATAKVRRLVHVLKNCCNVTTACETDNDLISRIMLEASQASAATPGLDGVLQELFTRISRPALARLSDSMGLSSEPAGDEVQRRLGVEDEEGTPWQKFLPTDAMLLIAQTQRSLDLLHEFAQDSPLCHGSRRLLAFGDMRLDLAYTYDTICKHQESSSRYEKEMKARILSPSVLFVGGGDQATSVQIPQQHSCVYKADFDSQFRLDLDLFRLDLPKSENAQHDVLEARVDAYLSDTSLEDCPTLQLDLHQALICSISPIIEVQHRLTSYSVLQLLFQEQDLLAHIKLQQSFHLFGDATFSQRLSIALFDSNESSGEGTRQTGASTGLRLQARDSWPPAGSELRLVLMGILSDSLATSTEHKIIDSISFAIRDLSMEDLEKCRDIDSIHALDFLRLQYKPSNHILSTVLTPNVLEKYDRIFQHLLRILRLRSVTQRLLRDNFTTNRTSVGKLADHKLVLQMHHFVSTLADFYQNNVMSHCWSKFDSTLTDVKTHIDRKDYERTLQTVKSPDYLRDLLERTLDDVLYVMLLDKRLSAGLDLLYEILNLILQYAASRSDKDDNAGLINSATAERLVRRRYWDDFKANMITFMDFLRLPGQIQAESGHITRRHGRRVERLQIDGHPREDDLFDQLPLKLDMLGYWDARSKGQTMYSHYAR